MICALVCLAGLAPADAWSAGEDKAAPAGQVGDAAAGDSAVSEEASAAAVDENNLVSSIPPPLSAEEVAKQPFGMIRTLQAVQDQVASGNATAFEFQRRYLGQLGRDLRNVPSEVWDDPRNGRAVVVYVLSGGDPRLAQELLKRDPPVPIDSALLRAALAFGEGRAKDAMHYFGRLDIRALDRGVAGIVALIYGTLLSTTEPEKAMRMFDDARLLSPGTLVEESALRQEILLVARQGLMDRFDVLSSQYARRFGKSIYSGNFRRQFIAGVARQDFKGTEEWISRTEKELKKLAPPDRLGAYLAIAKEAAIGGNLVIADYAAKSAAELSRAGTRERARAKIYEGATLILGDEYEKGVDTLKSVSRAGLRKSDKGLLDAAMSVSTALRLPPVAPETSAEALPETVTKAQDLISGVDMLLGGENE
jgi:chemotaxis protein MotC